MFSVDGWGWCHIVKKDGLRVTLLHRGQNRAVSIGCPSDIFFEMRGLHVAFLANGQGLVKIPH
ncbi:MAG: hypothetical protein AAF844_10250 [Pseudomonadota bacterium]